MGKCAKRISRSQYVSISKNDKKKVALQAMCIAIGAQWFMFQHQPTSVKSFNMVKCEYVDGVNMLRQDYRRTCEEKFTFHTCILH